MTLIHVAVVACIPLLLRFRVWFSCVDSSGAVFGGDTVGAVFSRCSLSCCVHIVLSSMQIIFSASIGVHVTVTGTVGDGVVLFRVGDDGDGKFVVDVGSRID